MQKITFFGDMMCEPPILKGAKRQGGKYDFNPIFDHVRDLLKESDFVVSNLETPMAGKDAGYTDNYFVFNAPEEYADAIKAAGVDLTITVNNHVLDRGFEGLVHTLKVLDEKGMAHTGTWAKGEDREEAYYFDMDGTKVAVIAYSYGTNWNKKQPLLEGELEGTANLLRHQSHSTFLKGHSPAKHWLLRRLKFIPLETAGRICKFFGVPAGYPRKDDKLIKELTDPYMAKMQADIRAAKEKADIVILAPHMGGQFHNDPGRFSKYVMQRALEAEPDAIMSSHAHCPQQVEMVGDVPCAWSLGNFSMDPSSSLMFPVSMSTFGLAVHMYVEDKKIMRTTFSVFKALRKYGKQVEVWPIDKLYENLKSQKAKEQLKRDMQRLFTIVCKASLTENIIRREYEIPEL